jgi:pilus assembly protein FimV
MSPVWAVPGGFPPLEEPDDDPLEELELELDAPDDEPLEEAPPELEVDPEDVAPELDPDVEAEPEVEADVEPELDPELELVAVPEVEPDVEPGSDPEEPLDVAPEAVLLDELVEPPPPDDPADPELELVPAYGSLVFDVPHAARAPTAPRTTNRLRE